MVGLSQLAAARQKTAFTLASPSLSVAATFRILVHGQVTIIFVVTTVGLSVCADLFSAVFDPISMKHGHMLHVWVYFF